ncbi:hypothetical protein GCM10012275_46800 [Longimycelium tulufanense]|uniref:Uncharacterized protein n=1 Tax=Longimycelium tulufanense TaxID=907463 RepID=A0A8J3CFD3_9PSEU|nr:hypothetical protein GCM10012275_46800 [Longimycelium tulufanense]
MIFKTGWATTQRAELRPGERGLEPRGRRAGVTGAGSVGQLSRTAGGLSVAIGHHRGFVGLWEKTRTPTKGSG